MFDAVVGGIESDEFLRQSRIDRRRLGEGKAQTRYGEIAGANHFTVVDPLNDPTAR